MKDFNASFRYELLLEMDSCLIRKTGSEKDLSDETIKLLVLLSAINQIRQPMKRLSFFYFQGVIQFQFLML